MKNQIITIIGAAAGAVVSLMGGWDTAIQALVVFMILDYLTGMIVAGILHKSPHTETGGLSSAVGLKGLAKKVIMLVLVVAGQMVDNVLKVDYFRNAVIIALLANELISLTENAGVAGVNIPILSKAVEMLNESAKR